LLREPHGGTPLVDGAVAAGQIAPRVCGVHIVQHGSCAAPRNRLDVIPMDVILGGEVSPTQVALEPLVLLGPGCPLSGSGAIGGETLDLRAATVFDALDHRAARRGAAVGSNACRLTRLTVRLESVCAG